MSHDCDRVRVETLSRKSDKWKCIWCGAKQTVKKGAKPDGRCQRDLAPTPDDLAEQCKKETG